MAIAVTCPSCKAKFTVSDKFAGKQGPCPKCKAPITIPKAEAAASEPAVAKPPAPVAKPGAPAAKPGVPVAKSGAAAGKPGPAPAASQPAAAPAPEIVVHEPEPAGPKGASGRSVTKPLTRRETTFRWVPAIMIAGAVLVSLAAARLLGPQLQKPEFVWLRGIGLLLISPAIAVAGYSFLRDDELEPYRGRSLWIRASLCGFVYAALWGVFLFVPADATAEAWGWILVGPPFFLVGAGVAFATLDLDFGNAFFHYCFYVLLTLLLGAAAGLAMPWAAVAS